MPGKLLALPFNIKSMRDELLSLLNNIKITRVPIKTRPDKLSALRNTIKTMRVVLKTRRDDLLALHDTIKIRRIVLKMRDTSKIQQDQFVKFTEGIMYDCSRCSPRRRWLRNISAEDCAQSIVKYRPPTQTRRWSGLFVKNIIRYILLWQDHNAIAASNKL